MHSKRRTRTTAGFTLIELLVALAILAIIAAILFPVFAGVRERGRRTTCQSNLKQIALAMQQYVQDNNGTYPPNSDWGYAPYSYLKNIAVFRCSDHPPDVVFDQFTTEPPIVSANQLKIFEGATSPTDYSYNSMRLYVFQHASMHGTQEMVLATPSTIWLNVDAAFVSPEGEYSYGRFATRTSCGRKFGGSTIHSGAGNYSYVDGHVKWLTPEEAGEIECANGPLPAPFKD